MKKIISLLFIVMASLSSQAQQTPNPSELFDKWLDVLEEPLVSAKRSSDAVENLMAVTQSRIAAFNLQALGRTFSAINPEFGQIRFDFKKIEDGLGQIDKWNGQGLEKKVKEAKKAFALTLREEKWYGAKGKMAGIRNRIQELAKTVKQPEQKIMERLAESLREIVNTEYDFGGLETDNGLHEYKREIRWFMIEARMLDGMVSFRPDQKVCPNVKIFDLFRTKNSQTDDIDELLKPIRSSKYSQLAAAKPGLFTCQISACLFYALSDTVEKIGSIKDDVEHEFGDSGNDETPEKYKVKAEKVYEKINKTDAFNLLADELTMCAQ